MKRFVVVSVLVPISSRFGVVRGLREISRSCQCGKYEVRGEIEDRFDVCSQSKLRRLCIRGMSEEGGPAPIVRTVPAV